MKMVTKHMSDICEVILPAGWVRAEGFEYALKSSGGPHDKLLTQIRFPSTCRVMVDAGVRILSLANQLCSKGCPVKLIFEGENNGAQGYLIRANFFEELSPFIVVEPSPSENTFTIGSNSNLVEFKRISPGKEASKNTLVAALVHSLRATLKPEQTRNGLLTAAGTIFSELIQNIYDHSQTSIDGHVALQVYERGNIVRVVVSDSGVGLLSTLRPAIISTGYSNLPDADLLSIMFREGLSRNGPLRGDGIKACAKFALDLKAQIQVRLPNSSISFNPSYGGFQAVNAVLTSHLPLLWGTHFSFTFPLDN